MQTELFGKSQYGVHICPKCLSVGTIVEIGACCRIWQLLQADSVAAKSESSGCLSTNDTTLHDKE